MNSSSNVMPDSFDAQPVAPATLSPTRPFYWSVRRELWEYRSIYMAPLAIAGVILLSFFFVLIRLPKIMRNLAAIDDPMQQRHAIAHPFEIAAALILGAAFLVSIFYALDCLYGERRDRSILFWKSLPVSDLTTVLAKAAVPLVILPLLAFAITLGATSIMFLLACLVIAASGQSVATFWNLLEPFPVLGMLLYHLVTVHMLWYAPLYAWLLLVSAWARRAPILWAVLPPLAVGIFERMAFHSSLFANFIANRVGGGSEAVDPMQGDMPFHPGMHLTPGAFLATPGLWGGLIFAAIFLVAAARVRRARGPI
jgi:ABC-2 type transport system permease protein